VLIIPVASVVPVASSSAGNVSTTTSVSVHVIFSPVVVWAFLLPPKYIIDVNAVESKNAAKINMIIHLRTFFCVVIAIYDKE
jgi:hypothetical protein